MNMNKEQEFCNEIKKLAYKYKLNVFAVTDGASITVNRNSKIVKYHREKHKEWELDNGLNPEREWNYD